MRVAYVSGPYRSLAGPNGIWENIQRARTIALELWKRGYAAICPHQNTMMFDGACPDDVWLEGDLEILQRCDLIVVCPGWEISRGTLAEIALASQLGIPIYYAPNLPPAA